MVKSLMITLLTLLGVSGFSFAEDEKANIRLHVMTVEMSEADYRKMMRREQGNNKLTDYDYAMRFVKASKASIKNVNVMTCKSGDRCSYISAREETNPTEYDPTPIVCGPVSGIQIEEDESGVLSMPTAFETRLLGMVLDVETTLEVDGSIAVHLESDQSKRSRLVNIATKKTPQATQKLMMPVFKGLISNIRVRTKVGTFVLIKAQAANPSKQGNKVKILTFFKVEPLSTEQKQNDE